jgi:hypothetical protein
MSDEQENVEAGSETSGETAAAEVSQEASEATDTAAAEAEQPADAAAADAGGAAEETPDANESRTGFVTGARPGDECTCPDGRKGTVHSFDSGLVCIPNHEQGN